MKGRRKREIPEKTRRPAASFDTIPTCENPGTTPPGIGPDSSRVEGEYSLTTTPLRPLLSRSTSSFSIPATQMSRIVEDKRGGVGRPVQQLSSRDGATRTCVMSSACAGNDTRPRPLARQSPVTRVNPHFLNSLGLGKVDLKTPFNKNTITSVKTTLVKANNVNLLACSPSTKANRVQSQTRSPDSRKWEMCRMMPLVGWFSRGSPLSFRRRFIPKSPSSDLKTSLLRSAQISSLTLKGPG
ncbi:hypothetical protein PR048_018312 [Dryococelus australis]|uniref:Uncharacterized protein n=1 Tax=Dryococelus australis TaxID=614101 RepID=A0ABQ9HCA9_9NEOP|nr:hypothetical protein PR048_018312 [Dryococelus australis]